MSFLPIFLNLEGKKAVVFGGGRAAVIKIRKLLSFSCKPTVIALALNPEVEAWSRAGEIQLFQRAFQEADLEGAFLAVCACSGEVNEKIAALAKQRNILVCRTDIGGKGDFIFPAHKQEGDITIAVSTGGRYPLLAKAICDAAPCPKGSVLEGLEEKRRRIIQAVPDKEKRKKLLEEELWKTQKG